MFFVLKTIVELSSGLSLTQENSGKFEITVNLSKTLEILNVLKSQGSYKIKSNQENYFGYLK